MQDCLAGALRTVLRLPEPPDLTVAGRTDAGVHARGQVAHLDLPDVIWATATRPKSGGARAASSPATVGSPATAVLTRLGRVLPPDIRVRAIGPAPDGFDARFSALWRRYSYRVCDDPAMADPVRRRDTLCYPRPLNPERMNQAAAACLGEHDFAAFCRRRPGATTIRELLRLDWRRAGPGLIVGTVAADAFCHNMVRALAGALLAVGDGSRPPGWLAELLAARIRDPAVRVAPPHPLCLEQVGYPPDEQLSGRALLTRRSRELSERCPPAG